MTNLQKQNAIQFSKMHGLCNDFVVINTLTQAHLTEHIWSQLPIPELADRHAGIGFDQLLIITRDKKNSDHFYCHIFNADGSEALQCGNGLRCVARELHEQKLAGNTLTIVTRAGEFPVRIENYQTISVTMGVPEVTQQQLTLKDDVNISLIAMGNPHAIMKVETLDDAMMANQGKYIYQHQTFPDGINVGLMKIINQQSIVLRTLERGVGETNACGSNACAAVCAGIINNWLQNKDDLGIQVQCRGGLLSIKWPGINQQMTLTGPAVRVFSGAIHLNDVAS